jgi:hypothetical protein
MLLSRGERTLLGARDADGEIHGWAAVQVQQLPNIRVLHIYSIYAPGATTDDLFDKLKAYARANGCTTIRGACSEAVGRIWERRFNAQRLYTIFELETA